MSFTDMGVFLWNTFTGNAWPELAPILVTVSPIFLAAMLFAIMWGLWLDYIRSLKILGTKRILLELSLPRELMKSPLAMETFINSLHSTSDGNAFEKFWEGKVRAWNSLEIVSIEGAVRFLIWTEDKGKAAVMAALYAQFPDIEITEREDYSRSVHFDPKVNKIWCREYKLVKPDPYPIKTYVDYGLEKDPKEEFKTDPMTNLIEYLGSVPPNQQIWIQIMIQAHKKVRKAGNLFKTTDAYEDEAKKIVNEILLRDPVTKVAGKRDEKTGLSFVPSISEGEKKVSEAIERSLTKHAFDVGIRAVYVAPKSEYNAGLAGGISGCFKHFSSSNMNGFKPNDEVWQGKLDYPWDDFRDRKFNKYARLSLMAYKRRSYFYTPFEHKPIVLNSEELATIYHFPGAVAATPALSRIPSKKGQAPANLPI